MTCLEVGLLAHAGDVVELCVLVVAHVEGLAEVGHEGRLLLALRVAPDHVQDAVHYLHVELVQLECAVDTGYKYTGCPK